jgi:RNA polymerase-binding transcription factor DksA
MTDPAVRLAAQRSETLGLIESLDRRLAGIIESARHTSGDDEHDPEGVTIAYERAQVAGLLDQARAELKALDEAADRLAAGTYGVCSQCGADIAPERLEALPTTTRCIRCAS